MMCKYNPKSEKVKHPERAMSKTLFPIRRMRKIKNKKDKTDQKKKQTIEKETDVIEEELE